MTAMVFDRLPTAMSTPIRFSLPVLLPKLSTSYYSIDYQLFNYFALSEG